MSQIQKKKEQAMNLLEPLQSTYMVLCSAISKMDRKSYCALYRSNRSMMNFMDSCRSTIKPNLLKNEIVSFENYGMSLSSGYFRYEETEEPFENQNFAAALRNLFNQDGKYEVDEGQKRILEFIPTSKKCKKIHCKLSRKEFIHMFKGGKPERIVWNCFAEDMRQSLNCLKELEFPPGCPLMLQCHRIDSFARIMEITKPKELLLSNFSFWERRGNMCDYLKHPLFKTLDSLTIGYLDFHGPPRHLNVAALPPNFFAQLLGIPVPAAPANNAGAPAPAAPAAPANNAGAPAAAAPVNNFGALAAPAAAVPPANNNDEDEEEEDNSFHFGGLLEHLKVFEVTTTLNGNHDFEYKEMREALKNWCAGKNRLERISIRNVEKENGFPFGRHQDQNEYYRERTMRILNRENEPRWVPEIFNIVHSVNALSVSFHQLPQIMKEAIQNDQFTFGRTTKDEDEMNIRLLLCPSKKKMAYVYTSAWGEFAFRSFDFYPTKK